jgi:hypothetical protein
VKEIGKVVIVIAVMALAVYLASSQRWIDTIREAVFKLLVLMFIAWGVLGLFEWATGK